MSNNNNAGQSNTNYNWCARNGPQEPGEWIGGIGNQWENRNHPDDSFAEISENTEISHGDLRRLANTGEKNSQRCIMLMWKTLMSNNNNNNNNNSDNCSCRSNNNNRSHISICFGSQFLVIYIYILCRRKERNSPTGECKSNDGLMNQEYPHSVQGPIVERQCPGDIPRKPRIQWPKGNQTAIWKNLDHELSFLLTTHLKGPIDHQLSSFCRVIYDVCLEWFGAVTDKKIKLKENARIDDRYKKES